MNILNIAGYRFIKIPEASLISFRSQFVTYFLNKDIKGTILLSKEGINLSLAGEIADIEAFLTYLNQFELFTDLSLRRSFSQSIPFKRMRVKLKKEIVPFGLPEIDPVYKRANYIKPSALKRLLESTDDIILLDTRNEYEIEYGQFIHAISLNLRHFRNFPQASKALDIYQDHTIVTYCTGGIRCEKAASYLEEQGFNHVYQLEGGILKYFEEYGADYFEGSCFVFDERIAVDGELNPIQSD